MTNIKANSSDEVVVKQRSLYTGVIPVKVLAVNPTKDELKEFGIEVKEEPVYKEIPVGDNVFDKINILVANDELGVKFRFDLLINKNKLDVSSNGKTRYIDTLGANNEIRSMWAIDDDDFASQIENGSKLVTISAKPAYQGQFLLTNFIYNWLNIAAADGLDISDVEDLESFIKPYIKLYPNNKIKLLVGISSKEGKNYYTAYTKFFFRNTDKDFSKLNDILKSLPFKGDYQGSYEIKEFIPTATSIPDADKEKTKDEPLFD